MNGKIKLDKDVSEYRASAGIIPGSSDDEIINRLLQSDSFREEWPGLIAQTGGGEALILRLIVECFGLAPWNKQVPFLLAQDASRFETLVDSAEALLTHYVDMPHVQIFVAQSSVPPNENEDANCWKPSGIAEEQNRNRLASIHQLEWMIENLKGQRSFSERLHTNMFPKGQKRNQPNADRLVFQKLLTKKLNEKFAKPFVSFVVTASAAIYPTDETIDLATVRRAANREKGRR